MLAALFFAAALDLRLDYTRQSLTATYRHYTQYIGGVPVLGGEVIERVDDDGSVHEIYRSTGTARPAHRVLIERRPHEPIARYIDGETGAVLREIPMFFNIKGRVFEVNPVAKLNAPQLRDQNDSAAAVPDAAYSIVELPDLQPTGMLAGPNVRILDVQSPATPHADAAQPLLFDRSQAQFEEVNAYYLIDRAQRYLQSIGYAGKRRLVNYALPVDPHAFNGLDNSAYESSVVPGQGILFFGDGGTDDAEDSDIVLHEFTHAIQDFIAPGAFFGSSGSESRALAEGIADYWSFSQNWEQTVQSGRDPYCIGDWDARCDGDDPSQNCSYPPDADCLRRVDSAKTFADFSSVERAGQEHENGAIWSSALREIFDALRARRPADGRQLSDRIVIESMFGVPEGPTFAMLARNMVASARALAPADIDVVCSAMNRRGIFVTDCDRTPRGEFTLFQSSQDALTIGDARAIERVAVQIDARGDLDFVLVAPDGTTVALGRAEQATFGVNVAPLQSLASLRGRSAAGTWRLQTRGSGTLRSWSLLIQFAGDAPLAARPVSLAPRRHIAVVAHAGGVNGTAFVSDVRLYNRGAAPATVTAVYTPDAGGFAAVKITIAPKQIVALNDVVGATMQSTGLGALEFQGDVADLAVTSRAYTADARGTFGQFIAGTTTADAIGRPSRAWVTHLRNTTEFRSNVGFTEVAGEGGTVRVGSRDVVVAPFEHWQMPAEGEGNLAVDFSMVSGNARILAYGSMVDNRTGDAIYVPAQMASPEPETRYAPTISAAGALGTRWSTEVVVEPVSDPRGSVSFAFGGAVAGVLLPTWFENILPSLFRRDETLGLLAADLPPAAIATARIYTVTDGGTFGQFVPFLPPGHGGDLIQLESSDAFRTNIGAANTNAQPVLARFTAFDADGSLLGTTERFLQPFELVQFPLRSFAARDAGSARVRVEGDVLAYASVVDNRSGDAIYIPAQ